jgi:Family of unknown function (DUF6364)
MTKNITLAIEDHIVEEARILAAEQKTTVNAMVRDFLRKIVARRRLSSALADVSAINADIAAANDKAVSVHETAHEKMVRLRAEGEAKYADRQWFDREYTYDRDYQRAEQYFENRAALLKLIDESTADMGTQKWNREALYDR